MATYFSCGSPQNHILICRLPGDTALNECASPTFKQFWRELASVRLFFILENERAVGVPYPPHPLTLPLCTLSVGWSPDNLCVARLTAMFSYTGYPIYPICAVFVLNLDLNTIQDYIARLLRTLTSTDL